MELSRNLKFLIQRSQITVAELSRRTGVPKQTIHNWLIGMKPRSSKKVRRIAEYFEITIDDLYFKIVVCETAN